MGGSPPDVGLARCESRSPTVCVPADARPGKVYSEPCHEARINPMMRGRLKTRHIVLLVHLDEQRSVLRAAKAANMTQPGASKLLSDLEESLGVQLFKRHARGIEPTQYGEIMMRHARSALAEMDRAQDEIAALRSGLAGQCTIGAVVSAGTSLAPTAVVLLKQQHPRIRVSIEIDNSAALVDRLLKGELDIALARVPDSHGADELIFEALAGETHHVIARAATSARRQTSSGPRRPRGSALDPSAFRQPAQGSDRCHVCSTRPRPAAQPGRDNFYPGDNQPAAKDRHGCRVAGRER